MARRKMAASQKAGPLRELREKANLTPAEVAEALGLSEGAYRAYECGTSSPTVHDIPVLARTFGLGNEQLLQRLSVIGGAEAEDPRVPEVALTPAAIAAVAEAVKRSVGEELRALEEVLGAQANKAGDNKPVDSQKNEHFAQTTGEQVLRVVRYYWSSLKGQEREAFEKMLKDFLGAAERSPAAPGARR